ncbi:NAD(P)/FAD-dependent oxidoreductase [Alkaliphilus pronyensis]|uniref:NAD(P)/FAD-dependent oxidoreductase n=2 Tax=Alkaliphilus pronyensis TaxID=1482732 RepID=A0A6I0FA57_9FIRM|nr:NAD(P)/FAD-dependent oxidoreductase [Alkaliphilus pronyensis]
MMAAITAANNDKKVILLEKNNSLGTKLRITGGGRCNITNAASSDKMLEKVVRNRKFLYPSFKAMSGQDLINTLKKLGLSLRIEEEGRVFPEGNKAEDVIALLKNQLIANNVDIRLNNEAKGLIVSENKIKGVSLGNGQTVMGDTVIISTGGQSYPYTGSNGDGYRLAKSVGHSIVPVRGSLVPIVIEELWIRQLMGISLEKVNITISGKRNKKNIISGGLVFTHYGISGPAVLQASAYILEYDRQEIPKLKIDLLPSISENQLNNLLINGINNRNDSLKNCLNSFLPKNFITALLKNTKINPEKQLNQVTKKERNQLLMALKRLELTVKSLGGLNEAIITAGGISVKEINPATMESKLIKGLFFTGEVIDVDALTGGYNLHIAFSTGYLAGLNS